MTMLAVVAARFQWFAEDEPLYGASQTAVASAHFRFELASEERFLIDRVLQVTVQRNREMMLETLILLMKKMRKLPKGSC